MSSNPNNIIDLDKVSAALKSLDDQNSADLTSLWSELEKFKVAIGPDLNPAEFRQVMTVLFNDQVVTDPSKDTIEPSDEDSDAELSSEQLAEVAGGFGTFNTRLRFRQPVKLLQTGRFTLRQNI